MSGNRPGPSPLLIVIIGALVVFGGYFVWTGFLSFLEDRGDITAQVTREAFSTATARAIKPKASPFFPATFTPLPPCQTFRVSVERAVYRSCPSTDDKQCPRIDSLEFDTEVCVYQRVPDAPEWYVVELNPGGAYRDIVYMHESVLKAANPTPPPSDTPQPLPTVSPLPTTTPAPTTPAAPDSALTPSSGETPSPAPPDATPTLTPSPTLPQTII